MKAPLLLSAAAVLASALAAPVSAHGSLQHHVHAGDDIITATGPRPVWAHRIDPSILHPIPKRIPIPIPGPGCLSCPAMDLDQRVIMPRQLIAH